MKVRYDACAEPTSRLARIWHLVGGGARVVRWRLFGRSPDFGPLNGQTARRRAVNALFERFKPMTVVETGTYLATTTSFLADRGLPTFSVEINPMYVGIARVRLRSRENVTVLVGDSARALSLLGQEGRLERPFVYLDAHAPGGRLPLKDELEAVESAAEHAVVVIDDALIPHDEGYGYDVYDGVPIALDMIRQPAGCRAAYPVTPAAEESGGRRGTMYLGLGDGGAAIGALVAEGLLVDAA